MNGVPNGNQMMGGNGAPNGNLSAKRKKLQPISNCVNIYDLRKLMGSWKMAGITYAQMLKVLRLYLGESGWMDIYGRYPYNNLYPIAKGMKFSSVTEFFKCIRRCKGFGFVYHGGIHDLEHLDSFFSELWHPVDSQENAVYYSPLTESSDDNNNININNKIYIIIIARLRESRVAMQNPPLTTRLSPTSCSSSSRMRAHGRVSSRIWMRSV